MTTNLNLIEGIYAYELVVNEVKKTASIHKIELDSVLGEDDKDKELKIVLVSPKGRSWIRVSTADPEFGGKIRISSRERVFNFSLEEWNNLRNNGVISANMGNVKNHKKFFTIKLEELKKQIENLGIEFPEYLMNVLVDTHIA